MGPDYILIFVVAQRVLVNGTSFYTLGGGGDKRKFYWLFKIRGIDNLSKYLQADGFTPKPKFWNTTLIGQLLPFTLRDYTSSDNRQQRLPTTINNTIFHKYKSDAIALYSKSL